MSDGVSYFHFGNNSDARKIVGGVGMTESEAIMIIDNEKPSCGEKIIFAEGDRCEAIDMAVNALEEIEQYRAIGTPEECRAAVEKQTAKLVIDNTPTEDSVWYQCPTCKGDLTTIRGFYCQYCGQKLHWR